MMLEVERVGGVRMSKLKNEIGNRYDRLTVLSRAENNERGRACWLCQCTCGNKTIVSGGCLRNGDTKSCGCLNIDKIIERNKLNKGQIPWNKGKTGVYSKDTLQKMSKNHTDMSGKNNPNYKHGQWGTKEYICMTATKRRALKLNQTPELTENEKAKVEMYYKVSQQLGADWHVDHIIPLTKGGLHHPDNLQVVTKEYNMYKSNKLNFRAPTALENWRI